MLHLRLALVFLSCLGILSCASSPVEDPGRTAFSYQGGQVSVIKNQSDCFLLIDGNINQALKTAFANAKNSAKQLACNEKMVMIKSHGGDIEVAMDLGRQIRSEKWNTDMHGFCESACALVYIGGVKRFAHLNSQIVENTNLGVHQPASELLFHKCIANDSKSGPIVQQISQYIHQMLSPGAADHLVDWLFATSCQKITYIDASTLLKTGVATTQVDFH